MKCVLAPDWVINSAVSGHSGGLVDIVNHISHEGVFGKNTINVLIQSGRSPLVMFHET
jgi:hypothetical protein